MVPGVKLAHLQITLKCNLRCPFCGQWGEEGYVKKNGTGKELPIEKWLDAIDQIVELGEDGKKPNFVIWGGEPLLHKDLAPILEKIHAHGCRSALVTNGALLEERAETLDGNLSTLYLSLDGAGTEHDRIRGSEGLHLKIERGMAKLSGSKVRKVCLSTVNSWNWSMMGDIALYAQSLGMEKIIFQNLIYNLPCDHEAYAGWLKDKFSIEGIPDSWTYGKVPDFAAKLPEAYKRMEGRKANGEFKIKVEFQPLGLDSSNVLARMEGRLERLPGSPAHCLAPERHINVSPDGAVRFCVDYNEFSLGNLSEKPLRELLGSARAELFRKEIAAGGNPSCKRCPWRHNSGYEID